MQKISENYENQDMQCCGLTSNGCCNMHNKESCNKIKPDVKCFPEPDKTMQRECGSSVIFLKHACISL